MTALAKRVLGVESGPERFMAELADCLARVRSAYNEELI
jgi:hypothetical protein